MSFFLTDAQRRVLQTARRDLVQKMQSLSEVLDLCVVYGIVNESLHHKITSKQSDAEDKIRQLLDEALPRLSSDGFDRFCAVLYSTGNDNLGQLLRDAVANNAVFSAVLKAEEEKPPIDSGSTTSEPTTTTAHSGDEDELTPELIAEESSLYPDLLAFPFDFSVTRRTPINPSLVVNGGRGLIISCRNFDSLPSRIGNDADQMAFKSLFSKVGIECDALQDVRFDELEAYLAKLSSDLNTATPTQERSCFVLIILSYCGSHADSFLTSDEREVRIPDIVKHLATEESTQHQRTKLFISYLQTPTGRAHETGNDLGTAWQFEASVSDTYCLCARNRAEFRLNELRNGTWFPILFSLIVSRYAYVESLRKMVRRMVRISKRIEQQLSTTASDTVQLSLFTPLNRLRSTIYFNTLAY